MNLKKELTPIFHWSGKYVGFIAEACLFDLNGRYLGWHDKDGTVWRADGFYFGQLTDKHYILRNSIQCQPVRQTPRVPPVPHEPPFPSAPRIPCIPRPGWIDSLEEITRPPSTDDLQGNWDCKGDQLILKSNGHCTWEKNGQSFAENKWGLDGEILTFYDEDQKKMDYRIIAYTGNQLTIRLQSNKLRTLEVILNRID